MNTTDTTLSPSAQAAGAAPVKPASSWKKKLLMICGIFLLCCGITAAATAWWVKRNIYASPLKPVMLSQSEQAALDEKLQIIKAEAAPPADGKTEEQRAAEAKRALSITEHEINGYLAKQGLGEQFKVSLGNGDAAVTLVAPVDKGVPFIGGTTLRVKVALNASIDSGKQCALSIADVSVGGVPLPNAWLGDIKGVNMLAAHVRTDPVAKRFLDGIRELDISKGAIRVVLNE